MEFGKKIAAIRGAEGLSREKFAELCSLSAMGIRDIEDGGSCTDRSRSKIERAARRLGYKITETGIEQADLNTEILQGDDRLIELFSQIPLKEECLINGADESKTPENLVMVVQGMRSKGLKLRHLIRQGDTCMRGTADEYRWVPAKYFTNLPRILFDETLALLGRDRIILIHDPDLAEAERRQFNMLWDMLPQPDKPSTAKRYV